jgi:hypothetical protein
MLKPDLRFCEAASFFVGPSFFAAGAGFGFDPTIGLGAKIGFGIENSGFISSAETGGRI